MILSTGRSALGGVFTLSVFALSAGWLLGCGGEGERESGPTNAYCIEKGAHEPCGRSCSIANPCPNEFYCLDGACAADCRVSEDFLCKDGSSCDPGSGQCASLADTTECSKSDVLIVLDASASMHREPDGTSSRNSGILGTDEGARDRSRWALAVEALEDLGKAVDEVSFGLDVFPANSGSFAKGCLTLPEFVGPALTNEQCLVGSLDPMSPDYFPPPVPIGPDQGSALTEYLDRDTVPLCLSTPTFGALERARMLVADAQAEEADERRSALVILVTDGAQTCTPNLADTPAGGDDPFAFVAAAALQADGVDVLPIGFEAPDADGTLSSVRPDGLNAIACAGGTARLPDECPDSPDTLADFGVEPRQFTLATNKESLRDAIFERISGVCCGTCLE